MGAKTPIFQSVAKIQHKLSGKSLKYNAFICPIVLEKVLK
jgi:hypothetical protein